MGTRTGRKKVPSILRPLFFHSREVPVINSILYSQSYLSREPILLNVGTKQDNYDSLATYLASEATSATTLANSSGVTVDLALDKVAGKMLTELASLTAETILDYPEFQDDYILAIIDREDGSREARVYSREEIVNSFEGTKEEKNALKEALAKEPLLVFSSDEGLPQSSQSEAANSLSAKANEFLSTNEKLLNLLDSYGYNPFDKLKQ
jgi:hypothetical protein